MGDDAGSPTNPPVEAPEAPAAGVKRPAADHAAGDDPLASGSDPKRASTSEPEAAPSAGSEETIQIKVVVGGAGTETVTRRLDSTVLDLKRAIESRTGIPADARMRLLFKGQLKDDQATLRAAGLKNGSKLMVVGSKPSAAAAAAEAGPAPGAAPADWDAAAPKKEPWSEQAQHQKVVAKGRPEDGWPGLRDRQVPLREDQTFLPGLLSSTGTKVRLTFKPELGQIWMGSAAHTQKISVASIKKIEAQPITGQPEYSIVRLQLGATASSSSWLYFVPSQHVASLKIRVLGVASLLE